MVKAAETEDWRKRYMDCLRTMDHDERQARERQQFLYKLVGRLCTAALGQSTRLDKELSRLKDAIRKEVAPEQLESVSQAIATAVVELDREAPQSTATITLLTSTNVVKQELVGEERIRSLLARLLAEASEEEQLKSAVNAIKPELNDKLDTENLPGLVERVGGLVVQRVQRIEKSRQQLQNLLGQMIVQLDTLTRHVEVSAADETERSSSSSTLNRQISDELQAMGESVAGGTDLNQIRQHLRQRLDTISRHLLDFRERETARAEQVQQRNEQLRARMEEMESEARSLRARLLDERRLSMFDTLTQIPNRLAYEQRIGEELERWARFSQPTCLAVWDIDRFKSINDQYGHRAGDKVIAVVAETLAKSIRGTDFVARYGGEEFVMVLPGTRLQDALRMAEQMREAVAQLGFHFRGTPIAITISGGVVALQAGDTAEAAFDRADNAMYRAKEAGRNRVVSA